MASEQNNSSGIFSGALIVSDYDGTVAYNGTIPEGNVKAIEYFNANGGMFSLASGRAEFILDNICPDVRRVCNAPSILSNGSYLYDFVNNEYLYETFMEEAPIKSMLFEIHSIDPTAGIRIIRGGTMITPDRTPEIEFQIKNGYVKDITTFTFASIPVDRYNKVTVCAEPDKVERMQKELSKRYSAYYMITKSAARILEIQNRKVSKGQMVERVREVVEQRTGTKRTLYCVGNYENDMDLLKMGDHACCPADSLQSVIDMCDVVLCNCNECSIADLISRIEKEVI